MCSRNKKDPAVFLLAWNCICKVSGPRGGTRTDSVMRTKSAISFSFVVSVSDFCFPTIFSLSISRTITLIYRHRSQWHLRTRRGKSILVFAFSFYEWDTHSEVSVQYDDNTITQYHSADKSFRRWRVRVFANKYNIKR